MSHKIIFLVFLISSLEGLAQQRPAIKLPPLSVVIESPSQEPVFVPNPEGYLKSLGKHILPSVLSPQELWDVRKSQTITKQKIQKIYHFRDWFLTQLPALVPAHKRVQKDDLDVISEESFQQMAFLFQTEGPILAQDIITLAESYPYTEPEKLNLFLMALYKNISDEELLKILEKWQITENKAVYLQDYRVYFNNFFQVYMGSALTEETKQQTLSILKEHKPPLTSLLHEAFNANRIRVFSYLLQNTQENINILNYVSQNIGHIVSSAPWTKGSAYLPLLLSHPHINWNQQDFRGWTPLFYAVLSSTDYSFPSVKLLLKQPQLNLDIVDHDRKSLLLISVETGKPHIAQFLHENGMPMPTYVNLQNSYMDQNFNIIKIEYKTMINLNNLVQPLNWFNHRPSFVDFQSIDISQVNLPPQEIWGQFKYYFLLHTLLSILQQEESHRHHYIMPFLLERNDKNSWIGQWIRAIYRGDHVKLTRLLSERDRSILEAPLFHVQHEVTHPYYQQALLSFNLLQKTKEHGISPESSKIIFELSVGSFLDEAIRANQPNSVRFFLSEGVDPTLNRADILLRNSIITAMLIGDLFLPDPDSQKEHLRIMDLLMNHPSVDRGFLRKEVIPGLTYPDLASFKGHLPLLKQMSKKGATVSKEGLLWDTKIALRNMAFAFGFLKTAEFVLKEQVQSDPENLELKRELQVCQRAFH